MDHKIITTNSAIIINDYMMGDCPSLEYNFKTFRPTMTGGQIPKNLGMYYDKDKRRLYLPRGIDIHLVMNKIQSSQSYNPEEQQLIKQKKCHPFGKITGMNLKYGPKDDRQKEALRFLLCYDKYKANQYKSQFAINLPTGAGKTYCSTACISALGIKSVIITNQSSLLSQWKSDIVKYTNINPVLIQFVDTSAMERIMNNRSNIGGSSIFLITHATIRSYVDQYGWESLGTVFEKLKIGLKIFDESHQHFENMTMIDFHTNVYRTYYVTATPNRSDAQENKIYSLYMKNVPSISLFDEDSDPHTKYIALRYNTLPRPIDISRCRNQYNLDRNKYIDYLMKNEQFWKLFDYVFNMVEKMGGRVLIFVGKNDGILKVRDRIIRHYPEFENDIGIYTSISENKADAKTKRFILSTTKSAGAGEHIEGLKYTIVLAEPFKSEVIAKQTLGRTRDDDTFYIEVVDTGFKTISNFYNHKKPIFNKYALSTKQIDINKYKLDEVYFRAYKERINRHKRMIQYGYTVPAIPMVQHLNRTTTTVPMIEYINKGEE